MEHASADAGKHSIARDGSVASSSSSTSRKDDEPSVARRKHPDKGSHSVRLNTGKNEQDNKRGGYADQSLRSVPWRPEADDDDFDEDERDQEGLDETLFKHDHTFDKLQEIYQHTLAGLDISESKGVNLVPVKKLFMKLWDGIQRSHHNVVRLQNKDHDISVNLSAVMGRTRTLIKLAEEDPEVAFRLRSKLESAWGLADIGEAEERKNAIRVYELKEDVYILNRSVDAAAKTEGQSTVVELTKLKAQFEGQKATVSAEVAKLNSDLKIIFEKRQELAELKTNLEEKMKLLSDEELIYMEAINREKLRKNRIQEEIKQTMLKSEEKTEVVEELLKNLNNAEKKLSDVERRVRERRLLNEDVIHELEILNNKYIKLKGDLENQVNSCQRLTTDLFKRQADLKGRENEVLFARTMLSRMNRQKQANLKKVEEYKLVIANMEKERESLKVKLAILEKDLEEAQRQLEENRRRVEELDRERGIINRTLQRAVAVANAHDNQVLTHELAVRNLQTDIGGYEKDIAQQQKVIATLEKERDNYSREAMKLAHQVVVRLEECRKLDRNIYEYHRKLGRTETQLNKQQHVYDNAVYEKTVAQKQLRDATNEVMENSVKLTHLGHEIMGLKFLVGEKDAIIHIEATRYERVLRETTFYAGEGKRLKHMAYDMQRMVEALVSEQFILKKTVAAIESEMSKQLYYTTTAESRKEVFFRKLMGKDAELKEIWEKWRVLHSKIRIGAYHFRNVIADIRRIRVQIFEAKKENLMKSRETTKIKKLQHEISVLENIISKETCMCNSLKESMRHPINVHRWRVLECINPDAYDMVLKKNLLTKRLIDRNALLAKMEQELIYKQEIYCQIREALVKAPGLEIPENVAYYQYMVEAKRRQLKNIDFELSASQSYVDYYKHETIELTKAFSQLKKFYFRKMRTLRKKETHDYVSDVDLDDFAIAIPEDASP